MTDITHLEEQIAHLTRTVEDLSDIVARQETELAVATRRLATAPYEYRERVGR